MILKSMNSTVVTLNIAEAVSAKTGFDKVAATKDYVDTDIC